MLFGQQSSDSDGAVLCAAVAERLRLPLVCRCRDSSVKDGAVDAKRHTEFGYDHVAAPLPAVVAVSDVINEPRYPSLKGIMGAKVEAAGEPHGRRPGAGAAAMSVRVARARRYAASAVHRRAARR